MAGSRDWRYHEPRVLGDVILHKRYLRAECRTPNCYNSRLLSLPDLARKLGYDYPLGDLRKHLRCEKCGRKSARVKWLEPERG